MLFILLSSTFAWLPLLSLTPSLASPHSCSYFVVKSNCQIDSTFCLFARFSPTSPAYLSLSPTISLTLLPALSLSPVSHPDLAEPQIIEWFEFLYWICCLTRSLFLVPRSSLLCFSLHFPRLHFRTVPTRLFIFFSPTIFHCYFLPAVSFVSIFFSIKMEIVGELENCLSIGQRLQYASRIKRSCKLNMVGGGRGVHRGKLNSHTSLWNTPPLIPSPLSSCLCCN